MHLYSIEVTSIKSEFSITSELMIIKGHVNLNLQNISVKLLDELLKKTKLRDIIKETIIKEINNNIDKIMPFMLSNEAKDGLLDMIEVYCADKNEAGGRVKFYYSDYLSNISVNLVKEIKNAVFDI